MAGVRELIGNGNGGRLAPVEAATARYVAILGELGVTPDAASPAKQLTTALCILTRDRPLALTDALDSAIGFDETVVVDMASATPLEPRPDVIWHREETNLGVTRGRNLLVDLASADIVVFLDDDAVFLAGDGPAIADAFAQAPGTGALAFLVQRADGRVESPEWPFRGRPRDVDRPRRAAYFLGGACAVRRDAFLAAGGYDEAFFYSTEEIDLAFALSRLGRTIEYTPDVVVEHRPSEAGRVANPALPGLRLRNRIVFARRHLPVPIALVHVGAWGVRTAREARAAHGWSGWRAAWRQGRTAPVERRPLPYGLLGRLHHAGGRVLW